MRGTDQDIAGRECLEAALPEHAELFESVFNQAAVGIALTGPDRKVLRANRKICDLLGFEIDELVGTTLRARTHPDFVAQVDEQIRRLIDGEVESATIENLYIRKDGSTVWGDWTSSLIRDENGAPKIFVSVIQNIDDRKKVEDEARKIRDMLEHSQRVAHLGSWDLEIAEDIERWSDEAYRIFGLEPQSVIFDADGFLDYVHPDDRDIAETAQNVALEQLKPFSVEYRLVRPDGTERWVTEYAELEFDDKGVPIRLSGTIQDITELKRTERNLRETSRRLELAQKQAKIGYWHWSFEKKCLSYWSQEAAEISRYNPNAGRLDYKSSMAAIHPEDRPRVQAVFDAADLEPSDYSVEYRVVDDEGRIAHVREIGEVEHDESGQPVGHVGFVQDITELKQMEEALRKSEQRLNAFFAEAPAGLALYDGEGRFIRVNDTIARIVGFPAEAHIGKRPSEIMPPALAQEIEAANRRVMETGNRLVNIETSTPVPTARNEVRHYVYSRFPISSPEGERFGVGAVTVDITERKRAEQELARLNTELEQRVDERTVALRAAQEELLRNERLAALGQLTAIVSHELRNPLGAIRTSMYVVEKESESRNERLLQSIARINRNITRCDRIIDELLDYTRVRDLDVQNIPIDDWLASLLDEQPVPEGARIQRKFGTGGIVVAADADRLRRAVVNVYDNAFQAMAGLDRGSGPQRKLRLTIRTRVRNDRVELIFTDNGPGIPEDMIERIFEPLFSTKSFGIGLGLPVVRQIMEQHGGGVEVDGKRSDGTGFTLWLPLNLAVQPASP
jgi:PAS domain S-box-containing protein